MRASIWTLALVVLWALAIFIPLNFGVSTVSATADSDTTSVNLTVGNSAPTVDYIFPVAATNPNQASNRSVIVMFNASDVDGMGDLSNATAFVAAKGGVSGTPDRLNSSCDRASINSTSLIYTCIIQMWYWDAPGTWTINASVNDSAGLSGLRTATFTYNTLTAQTLEPNNVTFGVLASAAVSGASNDPINLSDEGNANISTVNVNATELNSATDFILATAFSVNENDSATGAKALTNETNAALGWANVTAGNGTRENMYFYVNIPAGKAKESYASRRNWIVTVA